jgi:prolyl 4-hydroxylase
LIEFSELNALLKVLSWKPRALYFPNFASPEKCETIIKLAKARLRPSTLALRKGETEDTTKGIRTRYNAMILCFALFLGLLYLNS